MRWPLLRSLFALVLPLAFPGWALDLTPLAPIEQNVGEDARPQALALADLDGDAVLDLVVIDVDAEEIWAYLGVGDGTFGEGLFIGFADLPTAVAVADLTSAFETGGDIDGIPDVIVVDELGSVQIFIGRGDGTFDPPDQEFDDIDASELVGLAVADFDGDGRDDLAVLDSFDGVYFLCNNRGTMVPCPTPGVELDEFSSQLVDIAVGDFTGDGRLDVAVIDLDVAELYVIRGAGDGTFATDVEPIEVGPFGIEPRALRVLPPAAAGAAQRIAVLSVDDLREVPSAALSVFSAAAVPGGFARANFPAGEIGDAMAADDFDGDGNFDICIVGEDILDELAASTYLRGTGTGFFSPMSLTSEGLPGGRVLVSGDLDGNGKPDLVAVIDEGARVLVLLNDSEPRPLCVGDCDGNGVVSINELIRGVNIALGQAAVSTCLAMDRDGDGRVVISELVAAVNNALAGCVA